MQIFVYKWQNEIREKVVAIFRRHCSWEIIELIELRVFLNISGTCYSAKMPLPPEKFFEKYRFTVFCIVCCYFHRKVNIPYEI